MSENHYAYEAWEHVTQNEPTLSSIDEPLTLSELTSPVPALTAVLSEECDLTTNAETGKEAIGQRIIVSGRVMDEDGAPLPGVLIEIWQANAAGKYAHELDTVNAPTDPNFLGRGRCITNEQGVYRFCTIRPGAYPWNDETNQWRPAHIHLSVVGLAIASRLVTQMYFPGDALFFLDDIFQALSEGQKERAICRYDHELTEPGRALGFRFDIVLRGPLDTPWEIDHDHEGGA